MISIIIPTLNEAAYLGRTLEQFEGRSDLELIVCDCNSSDATLTVAEAGGARIVEGDPAPDSRARALNLGAIEARGDILLFLHADTLLPPNFEDHIRTCGAVGGAFEFALDGPGWKLRLVEILNRLRYRVFPRYFGDQAIFTQRDAFFAVDGYPEVEIMEDSAFCRQLRTRGRLALLRHPALTSPRRFHDGGPLRVLAHDAWLWLRDELRLSNTHAAHNYRRNNEDRG